jgi:hypothetical protein
MPHQESRAFVNVTAPPNGITECLRHRQLGSCRRGFVSLSKVSQEMEDLSILNPQACLVSLGCQGTPHARSQSSFGMSVIETGRWMTVLEGCIGTEPPRCC